jgi:oxygen-dependent protoporphyrinogen oxidase
MKNYKTVIGKIDSKKPIIIWGAGISGLLIGYFLKSHGYKVKIKEISGQSGGKISTIVEHDHVIERAANALFLDYYGYKLLSELKLLDQIIIPSKKLKRFIGYDDSFHSVFSQISILRILKNITLHTPPYSEYLTLEDFLKPWIGEKVIKQVLNPALGGIYATKSHNVLLNTLFDFTPENYPTSYWKFFQSVRTMRKNKIPSPIKGTIGFKGGMKTLIHGLEYNLQEEIEFLSKDRPQFEKDHNILCTDALTASNLLEEYRPEASAVLKKISYEKLNSHTLLLNREVTALKSSYGALFTEEYSLKNHGILGILANHNIFPANNPQHYSYTFISKTLEQPRNILLKTLQKFENDLNDQNIKASYSHDWQQGLPLYNKSRYEAITSLHQILDNHNGLCLFGNYVAGISMREMIQAAYNFAKEIKNG